jgi:ornithine carbamoyltransferase
MTNLQAPAIPRHFLRVTDLEPATLTGLLDLATRMKERPHGFFQTLRGDTVVCYFEKPSTRTRVSFAAAAERLGMLPLVLRPDELQLGRGETIGDTARTLSGYAAAIVVRTFAQATVDELADSASVPVINALTDDHHPCQALADLLTLREHFGRLEGLRVAFVGDGNNVVRSLAEAAALTGIELVLAAPSGYAEGIPVTVVSDPAEAVEGADAIYTDVWVSMGEEAERDARLAALRPYQVDESLLQRAKPEAVFMHCLPAHRGEEVTAAVLDGPQSIVWQQAENRMPTEEALLLALISREWEHA